MDNLKLFMVLLGCRLKGRHTEQHDIFFGIAGSIQELVPDINRFWKEAKGRLHVDAWREVTNVDGYEITVSIKKEGMGLMGTDGVKLFFLNLGGYKRNEFEEYHYKMLTISKDLTGAKLKAKQTAFYKHNGFGEAVAHIDDKYGVDVDDAYEVKDILPNNIKEKYFIEINPLKGETILDKLHLGYFPLEKL